VVRDDYKHIQQTKGRDNGHEEIAGDEALSVQLHRQRLANSSPNRGYERIATAAPLRIDVVRIPVGVNSQSGVKS
jgi:hypothetical protein